MQPINDQDSFVAQIADRVAEKCAEKVAQRITLHQQNSQREPDPRIQFTYYQDSIVERLSCGLYDPAQRKVMKMLKMVFTYEGVVSLPGGKARHTFSRPRTVGHH